MTVSWVEPQSEEQSTEALLTIILLVYAHLIYSITVSFSLFNSLCLVIVHSFDA